MLKLSGWSRVAAATVIGMVASGAMADISGSHAAFMIHAQNENGASATFQLGANDLFQDENGNYWWATQNQMTFNDPTSGEEVFTLNPEGRETSMYTIQDPQVTLNFAVQSGGSATTFTIASALLTFAPITNGTARAGSSVTITDINGAGPAGTTARLLGSSPTGSGMSYLTQFNGFAPLNTGTTFVEQIASVSETLPFQSESASANQPFTLVPGAVSSMSSVMQFSLSARDIAAGNAIFEIVPEPASIALLSLGLLALRRR